MNKVVVTYQNQSFYCDNDTSVLDCLLANGIDIPHGCRAGACQSCAVILDSGEIDPVALHGLTPEQRQAGLFLSCLCKPQQALRIHARTAESQWQKVRLLDREWLSKRVLRLRLDCRVSWQAGQYFTLSLDRKQVRCYSAASSAQAHDYLDLHIRHFPGGALSGALADEHFAQDHGDTPLWLSGPHGHCHYDRHSTRPLLLIGQGTGLAPLQAIAEQAFISNHPERIALLGITDPDDEPYWQSIIEALNRFTTPYTHRLVDRTASDANDDIAAFLDDCAAGLSDMQIYVFGQGDFVGQIQRLCALRGASRRQFFSEIFLDFTAAPPL